MWRLVDKVIAQTFGQLIGKTYWNRLGGENNANRRFTNKQTFSAMERRILITHWAGEA